MKLGRAYRVTATLLAGFLVLFSVGIPVVLATCPMADGRGPACCACVDPLDGGTLRITRALDRSCCTTVIAAKGTITEYLPSTNQLPPRAAEVWIVSPPAAADLSLMPVLAGVVPSGHSPPGDADPCILHHSLII